MRKILVRVCVALYLTTATLPALEAVGTIQNLDVDRGVLQITANGGEHSVRIAPDVRVLGEDGKPLAGGLKAAELKAGAPVTVTIDRGADGPVLQSMQLGAHRGAGAPAGDAGKQATGFKPLTEMGAADRYQGEDGGLYGGGRNDPPPAHQAAAQQQTARIQPLDADGHPAADGKIGLVSISMSNATMEFSRFKQLADQDSRKSPQVAIVDCAQGGQAMAEWVDPEASAWTQTDRRLQQAGVSAKQVQVIWVKLANKLPSGDLPEHGRKLQRDTLAVLHNARARFPNLRIAYLGSRIYGGYAASHLNPEPYAYEGAFAVRWLIQDQIRGTSELAFDGAKAPAPLLLWGPYFWADGTTPRAADGLVWARSDLGPDGTHPSASGREKVAQMLLKFFAEDPLACSWFARRQP